VDAPVPLFPLHSVLFPDGLLPLRIFEPRYLDMVSRCLKQGHGFGVCLIREGKEVGTAAQPYSVGTLAEIVDWQRLEDGLLGLTVRGGQRFSIRSSRIEPDQLSLAEIEPFEDERQVPLSDEFGPLADLLSQLAGVLGQAAALPSGPHNDAGWVSWRLAELLPLSWEDKQQLLELVDPLRRLALLGDAIERLRED